MWEHVYPSSRVDMSDFSHMSFFMYSTGGRRRFRGAAVFRRGSWLVLILPCNLERVLQLPALTVCGTVCDPQSESPSTPTTVCLREVEGLSRRLQGRMSTSHDPRRKTAAPRKRRRPPVEYIKKDMCEKSDMSTLDEGYTCSHI